MRLIDADRLKTVIDSKLNLDCESCCDTDCHSCFVEWIDERKTIYFEPVPIGQFDDLHYLQKENEALKQENNELIKTIQDRSTCLECAENRKLYSQIRWERDMAMEQLNANGLKFGHKDCYGWIPCRERIPKEKGMYITTDELGIVETTYFDYGEYGWYTDASTNIIAWMPLPEPYEGE